MNKWLQDFSYRTNISWTVFVITTVSALRLPAGRQVALLYALFINDLNDAVSDTTGVEQRAKVKYKTYNILLTTTKICLRIISKPHGVV